MSDLNNILERLEFAVSRLETMAGPSGKSVCSAGGPISVCTAGGSVSVCSAGGSVSTCSAGGSRARYSSGSVPAGSVPAGSVPTQSLGLPVSGAPVSAYVQAFDDIISGPVAQYISLSKQIGDDVLKQAEAMKQAFSCQRQVLVTASRFQKPSDDVLATLLKPVSELIQNVENFRNNSRSSTFYKHICAVSDSVPALGWIGVTETPGPHVKDMQDAAMFNTNRVLKDFKDNKTHVEWVKAYHKTWTELQGYIKEHHTTGLSWSKSGPVASASAASASAALASAAPADECPPPPTDAGSGGGSESRKALFDAINKGVGPLTTRLKHVSDDQKTHKNKDLRAHGVPVRSVPKPSNATSSRAAILVLDGQKWKVENQVEAQGLVISDTELRQTVYVFKCNDTTLQVKGKVTSITIDTCKNMGLVFDDVVSTIEVINCKDVKIQVLGKSPTISISKTDGCHVYLSKDSLDCEVISGKSSELNILVPKTDGEFIEFTEIPVPELFKTVLCKSRLITTPADIVG